MLQNAAREKIVGGSNRAAYDVVLYFHKHVPGPRIQYFSVSHSSILMRLMRQIVPLHGQKSATAVEIQDESRTTGERLS
jgi:hypothetical protein